jgi:hypothetical protein
MFTFLCQSQSSNLELWYNKTSEIWVSQGGKNILPHSPLSKHLKIEEVQFPFAQMGG